MSLNDLSLLELKIDDNAYDFQSSIITALSKAELDLYEINESIASIKILKPECDKLDYALAASSGALCGIIDIFLVGKPSQSPVGDITDEWFANRTKDFAKLFGWEDDGKKPFSSAIKHLEKKFKIPYDQSSSGGAAKEVFHLTPSNHHFKSLAHNPSLLGLFFSILDQFNNSSHFVTGGQLVSLIEADGKFELQGHNVPSKLFCAIVNWFGHLISDMSGSHTSKGRGMGIPSPLWTWTNDIIAIKSKLNMPISQFDDNINEIAIKIFEQGYDARFQTTQAIPVFINELIVRLFYSIRRFGKYFAETNKDLRSVKSLWEACEPFSNHTVKRMLTVAHGTFCLIDIGDATVRGFIASGGSFNFTELLLRLNIVGVGRLTISLYGEVRRKVGYQSIEQELLFLKREKIIVQYYIEGLRILSETYDDKELLRFLNDLKNSEMYLTAFEKTIKLAEKRNVPAAKTLKSKADIDARFSRGKK